MTFSIRKPEKNISPPNGENNSQKQRDGSEPDTQGKQLEKRRLSNLFRRKPIENNVPEINLNAGLSRALKTPKINKKSAEDEANNQHAGTQALVAIEAVLYVMDRTREIISQCVEIAQSAKNTKEPGARALLAESYDELRLSIEEIANETDENGDLLIGPNAKNLEIEMTGRARYSVASFRLDCTPNGLNLPPPLNAFAEDEEIDNTLLQLQKVQDRVDRATAGYCRDAKFLMSRLDSNKEQGI